MAEPRDFGWWIESTDEETYGPVTRQTLNDFLQDGVISANTTVRHCTQVAPAPVVDQGLFEDFDWTAVKRTGDTLAESWPKRKRDRLALAESDVECAYHRRPAILACIRCLAPFCAKCQMRKRRGTTYYMCKKCQASVFNRRIVAYLGDSFLINMIPAMGMFVLVTVLGTVETAGLIINLTNVATTVVFVVRDPLLGGAGPCKRLFGLRVVAHKDGVTPLSYGQGFVRWLGHLVPFFNLVDASRAFSDPLHRRFGDSWAKTRVLDTPAKLAKVRARSLRRLERKGIEFSTESIMSMEEFARIDG